MAKKTREELLASIRTMLGDNSNTDEAIALYEDITDTFGPSKDDVDWEQKYKDNDAMWREKYSARFFEPKCDQDPNPIKQPQVEEEKPLSIDDILVTESEE